MVYSSRQCSRPTGYILVMMYSVNISLGIIILPFQPDLGCTAPHGGGTTLCIHYSCTQCGITHPLQVLSDTATRINSYQHYSSFMLFFVTIYSFHSMAYPPLSQNYTGRNLSYVSEVMPRKNRKKIINKMGCLSILPYDAFGGVNKVLGGLGPPSICTNR